MLKISYSGVLFALLILLSCSSEPAIKYNGESTTTVSIASLKSKYAGYPHAVKEDIYIEGVVVSSDRCLNIYKTVVVEDQTGALEVKIDIENVFERFKIGHSVRVRCNSLVLGAYGRLVQLGAPPTDPSRETDYISADLVDSYISVTDADPIAVVGRHIDIASLTPAMLSSLVALEQVQFIDQELQLQWCEPQVDSDRHLVDMRGDTLVVRTRSDAIFSRSRLPSGSGRIEGILSYFNRSYQLVVVDDFNVFMDQPRFTPHFRPK